MGIVVLQCGSGCCCIENMVIVNLSGDITTEKRMECKCI